MRFDKPDREDARKLTKIARALSTIRSAYPAMPSSYASAFLEVALEPGLGITEYAKRMGVIQPIMSRILLEIGPKSRNGREGLGLVDTQRNPEDFREMQVFLTPKGNALLSATLKAIGD